MEKNKNNRQNLTPLFALGFATASCGGGGGGSSSAPSAQPTAPPFVLPDEVPLALYENHPTNKAVYDATPQGQSSAKIDLPANTADNDLFRMSSDGRIWFQASPDYEAETDSNSDGVYIIRITHSHNDRGYTEIEVTVGDVAREINFEQRQNGENHAPFFTYRFSDIESILPSNAFVQMLLDGSAFAMPNEGPLELTWSLITYKSVKEDGVRTGQVTTSQGAIDHYRTIIARAFSEFEKHININFIEIADVADNVGDIRVDIREASSGGFGGLGSHSFVNVGRNAEFSTYIHEIGHALGLKHPFEARNGFPGDIALQERHDLSVMNYGVLSERRITQNDIAALQFLYGAPGTDFDGLQSKLEDIGITPEII